jgi:hypothetical protein
MRRAVAETEESYACVPGRLDEEDHPRDSKYGK